MKEETAKNINKMMNFIKTIVFDYAYESIEIKNKDVVIKYKGIIDRDKFCNNIYAFVSFYLYPSYFIIDYSNENFLIDHLEEDEGLNETYKKLYGFCYQHANTREFKIRQISDIINIMEEYYNNLY